MCTVSLPSTSFVGVVQTSVVDARYGIAMSSASKKQLCTSWTSDAAGLGLPADTSHADATANRMEGSLYVLMMPEADELRSHYSTLITAVSFMIIHLTISILVVK